MKKGTSDALPRIELKRKTQGVSVKIIGTKGQALTLLTYCYKYLEDLGMTPEDWHKVPEVSKQLELKKGKIEVRDEEEKTIEDLKK